MIYDTRKHTKIFAYSCRGRILDYTSFLLYEVEWLGDIREGGWWETDDGGHIGQRFTGWISMTERSLYELNIW